MAGVSGSWRLSSVARTSHLVAANTTEIFNLAINHFGGSAGVARPVKK
jgi:hypothetical protein